MSQDPISDMFASVWNGNHKFKERVDMPSSKIKKEIARLLKEEGYITDFKVLSERKHKILRVFLKYTPEKLRVLSGIKRVSRPGLRIYKNHRDLPRVDGGLGVSIISTSKGIMSDKESRKKKLGGEVVGMVW